MVLGAGAVGAATAIHLQKRGRQVVLVDRGWTGHGTSFGNAGLIQREGVFPYAFPRDLKALLQSATRRGVAVHYHTRALPDLLPFFLRYWRHSSPDRHAHVAKSYATLIEHSVAETRALSAEAGLDALRRPSGWLKVFRSARSRDRSMRRRPWSRSDRGPSW